MDNPAPCSAPSGVLDLRLGADPVMVLGVDEEVVLAQDAVAIGAPDEAVPGATVSAVLRLRDPRPVVLRAELPGGPAVDLHLDAAAPERTLVWSLDGAAAERTVAIRLSGTVGEGAGAIPFEHLAPILVTRTELGANLLGAAPFAGQAPAMRPWTGSVGRSRVKGGVRATIELPSIGAAGLATSAPLAVVPGRSYLVSARVSGRGELAGRVDLHDPAGKVVRTEHHLLSAQLDDRPEILAEIIHLPPEATGLALNLLLYNTAGNLTADAIRVERVRSDRPPHRAAFRTTARRLAAGATPADLLAGEAGELACGGPDGGIRIAGYAGAQDCSARARVGISGDRLLIACAVVDDVDCAEGDPARLWETDSLQFDVDPGSGIAGATTCQFSIGRRDGRAVVVRQSVIPTEDIVPSYGIGPSPAGVVAEVVRQGMVTRYLVSIPATAIWPNLRLDPGGELGFSLLVNDNDGGGRRGWVEWGGGIGDGRDAARFGSLVLAGP